MFQLFLHVLAVVTISIPTVLTYNLVFGKAKILHFGQIAFSLIGAYVFWVLVVRYDVSMLFAFLVAVTAIFIMSLLFTWLSLRLVEDAFGVLSIAVHLMCLAIVLNWQQVTRGALGIPGIPRFWLTDTLIGFTVLSTSIAVASILLVYFLDRGAIGRSISALSEHAWYAQSLGVHRAKLHTILFILAGIGALVTSVLFHSYIRLLSPIDFQFPAMIFYVMVIVAGGPGSVLGSITSLSCMVILRESLRFLPLSSSFTGPLELMLFGVILFVAVWLRRDTLFPKQRSV